jgi:arabinogalactan endo-1,4-beta-galactosidase/dienelactone hydrolase
MKFQNFDLRTKITTAVAALLLPGVPAFSQEFENSVSEDSSESRQDFEYERPLIGADISWVPSQEDRGTKFSDQGDEKDVLEILTDHHFNWIRLRLFVDPTVEDGYSEDGYCGLEQTLAMAKRIEEAGMKFLLDFHYSDNWADPGKQFTPASWKGLSDEGLAEKMYDYTHEVTQRFIDEGVAPEMIQIGNEIHNGFVWPQAKLPDSPETFGTLLRRASEAVRDADPDIKIMVHPALGGDNARSIAFFDLVRENGVIFDVIGQSYYPEHHGTLDELRTNLTDLATRYHKPIVVVEYQEHAKEVNEIVRDLPDGLGWGTFIWEATSARWGGLFDRDGSTTEKIDIYPEFAESVENDNAAKGEPGAITVIRDIAYREGESEAWRLDLAMLKEASDELRPALVIVHGGGWRGGSRTVDVFQKMMTDYAEKGYVTINVDYRLTGEAPFPACIEDVKCAVRWLRAHADKYGVDPDRIGAYGHSAGAHLAMMLAMAPKAAGLEGDGGWDEHSSRVNVVVGGSPPTELGRDSPMAKKEWWPIGYISGDHPPMFLVQGGADRIVRAELTEDFVEKMQAEEAQIEYLKIDDGGHGVAYAEALEVTDPAIEKFFAKHLRPESLQARTDSSQPFVVIENGGTGPHRAVVTEDRTLPGMTIFRPRDLTSFGSDQKLPVLLWGNGACANTTQEHKNFLSEIASHGYVILAIGLLDEIEVRGEASRQKTEASQLLTALDWITAENNSTESIYFGKVDSSEVAAMGMSCGGLQAIQISADPRITTSVVCNSGVLPEPSPMPGMPPLSKEVLEDFHAPVLYLMGGPSDIAYENAMDDFSRVNHVPIVMTNLDVGHAGTYSRPHGGEYTPVALAWLDWQLKGREDASEMFLGEDSTLKRDPEWSVETKNFAQ